MTEGKKQSIAERIDLMLNELSRSIRAFSWINFDKIRSVRQPVLVDTIYRGDDTLISLFVSGPLCRVRNDIHFENKPISTDFSVPVPMVLISDETELDRECIGRLPQRKKSGAPTFPVIIFPDDYFIIKYGDSFSYPEICDRYSRAANAPVMPFRRSDISGNSRYVREFLALIHAFVLIWETARSVERSIGILGDEIEALRIDRDKFRDQAAHLLTLQVNAKLSARIGTYSKLVTAQNTIRKLSENLQGLLGTLREQYDAHIRSIVINERYSDDSPFAVKMDLKYAQQKQELQNLCSQAEQSLTGGVLENSTQVIVRNTIEALASSTAHIAFVGTFSSGKTTMINAMLAHPHPLRTSGKHNTAVLTEICATDGEEYYEPVYRRNVLWSIVKPVPFASGSIRNDLSEIAEVREIVLQKDSYIVTLVGLNSRKSKQIRISCGHKLAVRKGYRAFPGESLIQTPESTDVYKLCSYRELEYLHRLVDTPGTTAVKLIVNTTVHQDADAKRILADIVNALLPFYQKTTMETETTISKEELQTLLHHVAERIRRINLSCDISFPEGQKTILNKNSWRYFVGDEEAGIRPFAEKPECYIPAKSIRVYLRSEFLRYCTITDTPGAGSVTDEHDSITESYIRTFQGRLFVMIAVNSHADDMKFNDLINHIATTFETYKKNKQEVIFVLNCFTSSTPMVFCQRIVEKFARKIEERGFSRDNIYVCNLRRAIKENAGSDMMMGWPSYAALKEHCVSALLQEATSKKYRLLFEKWDAFFKDNMEYTQSMHGEYVSKAKHGTQDLERIDRSIRSVRTVSVSGFEDFLRRKKGEYAQIAEDLEMLFRTEKRSTGVFWTHRNRREKLNEMINAELRPLVSDIWQDEAHEIRAMAERGIRKIQYYNCIDRSYRSTELEQTPPGMIGLSLDQIYTLLLDADENTSIWNADRESDTDAYMRRLHKIINQDACDFEDAARAYYNRLLKVFDSEKKSVLGMLQQSKSACQDPQEAQKLAQFYLQQHADLNDLYNRCFRPINRNNSDEEVNEYDCRNR